MLTHRLAREEEHPIANALEQTYVHTYLVQIYTHIHSVHSADIHTYSLSATGRACSVYIHRTTGSRYSLTTGYLPRHSEKVDSFVSYPHEYELTPKTTQYFKPFKQIRKSNTQVNQYIWSQ